MKRFLAVLLTLTVLLSFAACGSQADDPAVKSSGVMTYEEYADANLDTEVVIEAYVQATQSWYDNKITIYAQDPAGAYFLYNAVCSEEDAAKLVPGTKIKATGFKTEWAGEIELMEPTIEICDGSYIAQPADVTAMLNSDELIGSQNKLVSFKDMTIAPSTDASGNEAAFLYNWDGSGAAGSDSDLYFNASVNGQVYTFVVEYYLCNETTEVYKTVQNLSIGDTVDMEGFLYWYEGPNPHITSVTVK